MLSVILVSSLALLALVALLSITGTRRVRALYAAERAALLERGRQLPAAPPTTQVSAKLPVLVQDYLAAAGSSPRSLRVATLTQRGRLRAAADKPWMPFTAEQVYAFEPPGFVWLAQARVAPFIQILARDKFVGGRGNMRINLS